MKPIAILILTLAVSAIAGCSHTPTTPPLIQKYYTEIDAAYTFAKPCFNYMKDNNSNQDSSCYTFEEIYSPTKKNSAYKLIDPDVKKSFRYQWGYWNAKNGNIGLDKENAVIRTDNLYQTLDKNRVAPRAKP